jgi:two-component system chemotaxis response regulator CheB
MFPDCAFDLVVIAASAGGVVALKQIVATLPAWFPIPVAVVQHIGIQRSFMADVLGFRARMPVRFAQEGDRIRGGHVYLAPCSRHLSLGADRRFALSDGDRINFVRPAADPLFHSAAAMLGSRVLGVVLTGMGRDAACGARAIRDAGGVVVVEDPKTAFAPQMPSAAIDAGAADLVLDLPGIAPALLSLVTVHGTRQWLGLSRLAA